MISLRCKNGYCTGIFTFKSTFQLLQPYVTAAGSEHQKVSKWAGLMPWVLHSLSLVWWWHVTVVIFLRDWEDKDNEIMI